MRCRDVNEAGMIGAEAIGRLCAAEARLLARRSRAADPAGAAIEALGLASGTPQPADLAAVARAIGEAVQAHGASFPAGQEPAYHNRHHQAEATLAAGMPARRGRPA
jgi:hypothetical protein